jgi:hypothetical protein
MAPHRYLVHRGCHASVRAQARGRARTVRRAGLPGNTARQSNSPDRSCASWTSPSTPTGSCPIASSFPPSHVPAESVPALEAPSPKPRSSVAGDIEGPVTVVPSDVRSVTVTIERGTLPGGRSCADPQPTLRVNRSVIGRSSSCDVVIDDPRCRGARPHLAPGRSESSVSTWQLERHDRRRRAGRQLPVVVREGSRLLRRRRVQIPTERPDA